MTTPTFRPFSANDWLGFAGAERFADGSEPIIAEGRFTLAAQRDWLLVLDANGGCLMVADDPQTNFGGYALQHAFVSPAEAQAWFAEAIANPAHLLDFILAGFEKV